MAAKMYYDQDANLDLLRKKKVAIIGYGSQGHAHALNLKDSGVDVVVGLPATSKSVDKAKAAGLKVLTVGEAAAWADVIMILIPDQYQAKVYKAEIEPHLSAGKTLMFAHGFAIRFNWIVPPKDVDVSMIAPKAPGHRVREVFSAVFKKSPEELGMRLVYDVAHNIAKVERYPEGELVVHRKGATRALGPGSQDLPACYRSVGQPVICGGSMETGSYLLVGTARATDETFGSTMHGSGRTMSRTQAKKSIRGEQVQQQMKQRGILVKAVSMSGLAEEAGFAYKNISDVVESVDHAGITKKVAELRPIGNIKG